MTVNEEPIQYIKPSRAWRKFLSTDERVIFEARHHWTTWGWLEPIRAIVILVITVVTYEGVPAYFDKIPSINSAVDGALEFLTEGAVYATIYFIVLGIFASKTINEWRLSHSTTYLVTDERVICASHSSMSQRESWDMPLAMIQAVDAHQTMLERIVGYGTLKFTIENPDPTEPTDWVAVPHPLRARRLVMDAMDLAKASLKSRVDGTL